MTPEEIEQQLRSFGMDDSEVNDFLEHFGVKGMKWGVRNEDEPVGEKPSSKKETPKTGTSSKEKLIADYSKVTTPKPSPKEAAKNLAADKQKFANKFDSSKKEGDDFDENGNWRPTNKQVAAVAVGAAFVGLTAYGIYKHQSALAKVVPEGPVDPKTFQKLVTKSQMKTWGGSNYFTEEALRREEFSLPVGNVFHRISTTAETAPSSLSGIYATHNKDDFNRYVAGFRGELGDPPAGLFHVNFNAKEEIKVPSTITALETMRKVVGKEYGREATVEEAQRAYQSMSGTSWFGDRAKNFFSELQQQGYSAIVDEMDAGVIGETPLYIFNKSAISDYTHTKMPKSAIADAEAALIELAHRK